MMAAAKKAGVVKAGAVKARTGVVERNTAETRIFIS